jgi:dTDP-4-dehydrorhamnose 3,5-epimerase
MIDGVVIKALVTHVDERGFFRELLRASDDFSTAGFGQLSHSLVYPGVVKAWHGHRKQSQWTYVASGRLRVVLHDGRTQSPTCRQTMELEVGDGHPVRLYFFPPGVLHGYRCLSGPAQVIYVTSGEYDLADELRLPPDDPSVGYDFMAASRTTRGRGIEDHVL